MIMTSPANRQQKSSSSRTLAQQQPPKSSISIFSAEHVFLLLFAFRIVNALTLDTLYVPDEFYQSLEPAWQLAFGLKSGAWITWVGFCVFSGPQGLTSVAGMAEPAEVVTSSGPVCWHLSRCISALQVRRHLTCIAGCCPTCCTKSCAGSICSQSRFLHMETRAKDFRARQPHCLDWCMVLYIASTSHTNIGSSRLGSSQLAF